VNFLCFDRHHEAAQFAQSNTGTDLARLYNAQVGAVPFDDFDADEHKRNLELLLSQERVVALIYAKTFPISNKGTVAMAAGERGVRTVAIGMPSKPVLLQGRGAANNNGRVSPSDNFAGESSGMFGSSEDSVNRPQTTGAMTSSTTRSDKFPAIVSATNQPAARLASR
jgi:hypothetical protein